MPGKFFAGSGLAITILGGFLSSLVTLPALAQSPVTRPYPLRANASELAQRSTARQPNEIATQLLARINQLRIRQGLRPLQANPKLTQAAQAYSQRMAQQNCFRHDCTGTTPRQRVAATGLGANQVAENLFRAAQTRNPVNSAFNTWLQNMQHRCNLLLPEVAETGIGVWQQGENLYVTQLLIQPQQGPNQTPISRRADFETRFKQAIPAVAVQLYETFQTTEFGDQLQTPLCGITSSTQATATQLGALSRFTGKRTAVAYVVALQDQLQVVLVPPAAPRSALRSPHRVQLASATPGGQPVLAAVQPPVIRKVLGNVSRAQLLAVAQRFRREVSDPSRTNSQSYLAAAQQLYQWLVAPMEQQLRAHQIDTLLFSMDEGLRTLPMAALHDGRQFLVEQYGVALIPSFGLTQVRHTKLNALSILAMGISQSNQGESALPAVSMELSVLKDHLWPGQTQVTLNQTSTLANLRVISQRQQPGIVHLATHAEFKPGQARNSFIQFWDAKLGLNQLQRLSQELRWHHNPAVELLVLSACQTAVGSKEAELGFAGSAIAAGVPATLASLWSISDDGTLGVMSKFYQSLKQTPTKVEALRQAQLAMIKRELHIQNGQLHLSPTTQIPLPPALTAGGNRSFVHPYFWSGYTIVGNWN